jgi:hypothetical protein
LIYARLATSVGEGGCFIADYREAILKKKGSSDRKAEKAKLNL